MRSSEIGAARVDNHRRDGEVELEEGSASVRLHRYQADGDGLLPRSLTGSRERCRTTEDEMVKVEVSHVPSCPFLN
jgi:hypothetical protein